MFDYRRVISGPTLAMAWLQGQAVCGGTLPVDGQPTKGRGAFTASCSVVLMGLGAEEWGIIRHVLILFGSTILSRLGICASFQEPVSHRLTGHVSC